SPTSRITVSMPSVASASSSAVWPSGATSTTWRSSSSRRRSTRWRRGSSSTSRTCTADPDPTYGTTVMSLAVWSAVPPLPGAELVPGPPPRKPLTRTRTVLPVVTSLALASDRAWYVVVSFRAIWIVWPEAVLSVSVVAVTDSTVPWRVIPPPARNPPNPPWRLPPLPLPLPLPGNWPAAPLRNALTGAGAVSRPAAKATPPIARTTAIASTAFRILPPPGRVAGRAGVRGCVGADAGGGTGWVAGSVVVPGSNA